MDKLSRPPTLAARAAERIEDMITRGELPEGSRIPTEGELCARLGVSRNTVREAVRSLAHAGMLRARPGDGTYVAAASEMRAGLVHRARRGDLREAYELRMLLERDAAGKAAQRASAEDTAELRLRLDDLRAAVESRSVERYAKADAAFHTSVMSCAGNALAAEMHAHLGEALGVNVVADGWDHPAAVWQLRLHAELVEAIVARDGERAERCARRLGAGREDA